MTSFSPVSAMSLLWQWMLPLQGFQSSSWEPFQLRDLRKAPENVQIDSVTTYLAKLFEVQRFNLCWSLNLDGAKHRSEAVPRTCCWDGARMGYMYEGWQDDVQLKNGIVHVSIASIVTFQKRLSKYTYQQAIARSPQGVFMGGMAI